jgi:hypothetical protein
VDAEISEGLFESYLKEHGIDYQRHFRVFEEKNVDFKIDSPEVVLCDVKEVHDSTAETCGMIDAGRHIKDDLKKLRKKFGSAQPKVPVVLVTMNFSNNFFTGLTVASAMLGDVGMSFQSNSRGEAHHLPQGGNASLTKSTNTSISGILVYDCASGNHKYYSSPFANYKVSSGFFPDTVEVDLSKSAAEKDLTTLTSTMFWGAQYQW